MSKLSITIEDVDGAGVIIVGDPPMQELISRLRSRERLTDGELLAIAAWMALADQATKISRIATGERHG